MSPDEPHVSPLPSGATAGGGEPAATTSKTSPVRERIIEALMELAAEREWKDFGITDIAARAGISLADFRDVFPSKGAVLAAFSRKIDRLVLDGAGTALAGEAPRERLFDILMRRFDALAPYRLGLHSVFAWIRSDPLAAAALNGVALNSMRFMLAASGVEDESGAGTIKLQGLVWAWSRVFGTWLDDEDPGLARTMAALDKELARGETWVARIDDLDRLVSPLRLIGRALVEASGRRKGARASARPDPVGTIDPDPAI